MANKEQLKKTEKQSTTRRKTEAKPRTKAKATKAVTRKPSKVEAAAPAGTGNALGSSADGGQSLLDSVNEVVAASSIKIAEKLVEDAVSGNISSAKLLADLVMKKKAPAKDRGESQSQVVSRLADDPEWGNEQKAVTEN